MNLDISIILIYGNRTEKNIIFREDLERMQRQNRNLRVVLPSVNLVKGGMVRQDLSMLIW
jgi:NAD(P)H-flavin reductase